MGSLVEKDIPEVIQREPIRQIKFSTYITELLNGNSEFIQLVNDFIPQMDHKLFASIEDMKEMIKVVFDNIITNTLENVLSSDNLPELIQDDIIPTDAFITLVIIDLIYDQYNTNNFFVTNFPKLNLDLIQLYHYDATLYKESTRPWGDKFYKFYFNNFCNQTSIDILPSELECKYLSYSYNVKTSKFEYISHYTPDALAMESFDLQHIGCPFIISFTKGVIAFEIMNHGYIYRIIKQSVDKGNRFTFFPLLYVVHGHDAHACFMVFDNIYNLVFLLDPNGTTNYLTRYIVGNDDDEDTTKSEADDNVSLPYMVDAFNNYVDIFNKWNNTNYIYHCETYNNVNLNFLSEHSYSYEKGHCQPIILLLIHLLYMHQEIFSDNVPSDLNKLLRNLDLRSLIRIKYNFSSNLLNILDENGIIKLNQ
jgi:hypothetical protein